VSVSLRGGGGGGDGSSSEEKEETLAVRKRPVRRVKEETRGGAWETVTAVASSAALPCTREAALPPSLTRAATFRAEVTSHTPSDATTSTIPSATSPSGRAPPAGGGARLPVHLRGVQHVDGGDAPAVRDPHGGEPERDGQHHPRRRPADGAPLPARRRAALRADFAASVRHLLGDEVSLGGGFGTPAYHWTGSAADVHRSRLRAFENVFVGDAMGVVGATSGWTSFNARVAGAVGALRYANDACASTRADFRATPCCGAGEGAPPVCSELREAHAREGCGCER
jgi:hypothetical protein